MQQFTKRSFRSSFTQEVLSDSQNGQHIVCLPLSHISSRLPSPKPQEQNITCYLVGNKLARGSLPLLCGFASVHNVEAQGPSKSVRFFCIQHLNPSCGQYTALAICRPSPNRQVSPPLSSLVQPALQFSYAQNLWQLLCIRTLGSYDFLRIRGFTQ